MTIKNKKLIFIFKKISSVAIVATTLLQGAESLASPFYVGGGYQSTNLTFDDPEPRGSATSTFQRDTFDENGDPVLDENGDPVKEDYDIKHAAAYLDSKDYLADSFKNFNVFTGINLSDNMAFEIGFMYQEEDKANNDSNEFIYDGKTTESTSTLSILSADLVMSHLLIDDLMNLNVIVGGSAVSFKTETDFYSNGVYSNSESGDHLDFGLNLGVGVETKINKRIWFRTSVKGVLLPGSDLIQRMIIANVGLKIVL